MCSSDLVVPAGVVRRLEVEGDGDERLDALDIGGLGPKGGVGRGVGSDMVGEEARRRRGGTLARRR